MTGRVDSFMRTVWPHYRDVGNHGHLWARFVFLRALGLIFLSAFYSLAFQIYGLVGDRGILPADKYLTQLTAPALYADRCGANRFTSRTSARCP